ncbi:MAG: PQQ-binding-like beta-propeller repeat protein [Candidatus Bipolaricaulis sp.]|nr:PQQ-binding-like beta-propeller repeat protein [Candidatus Bipolaricaulis sp.]
MAVKQVGWVAAFAALIAFLGAGSVLGEVDLSDGVSVLLLMSEPYGANTTLWFNSFEKLGWNVTIAGLKDTIESCSFLCSPVKVDVTLDQLPGVGGFDALVVSTMPGTALRMAFPASDLRGSDLALGLIRQANAAGLTLYAGCSGLLVLSDAGILSGRRVVFHAMLPAHCADFGAVCVPGGQAQLPVTDKNLITGTSGRYFAQEVAEMISWSLDRAAQPPSPGSITVTDLDLEATPLPPAGPAATGWAIGGTRSDGARAVCPLEDGCALVGYTYSGPAGTCDLLALRCDAGGNVLWARAIGGAGTDAGEGVCATLDGGVVAVGRTTSVGAGVDDLWLVRLDAEGNLVWTRTFGGAGPDAGFGVAATADGGFVACGRTSEGIELPSDLLVVRIDADGRELWTTKIGGGRLERGHAVAESPDGTLFVAGGTTSSGKGNYDAWLVALSPEGALLWQKTYGLGQFDVAEDLVLTSDGGLFLTGTGDEDSRDGNDVLALRFDAAGTVAWAKRIGDNLSFDYGEAAVRLDDGGYLVCGARNAPSTMRNDAWLVRLAPDGKTVWTQDLGEPSENEWASAACRLASGQVVVVGHTLSVGAGAHDVLIYLVNPDWTP